LKEFPDLAIKLIDYLSAIIRSANQRLTQLVDPSPHQKIYAELIRLATPSTLEDGIWLIDPLPRHSEISGRAGTDNHDVSLAVGALIREGVARRRDNSLIIKDYPKLRMLRGL
jgi:CRP-like cAMP-binding protein